MNQNIVKETVYTLLAKGLSEKGHAEGMWFAGHIEAIYLSYMTYLEELGGVNISPSQIDKAIPTNVPTAKRKLFLKQAQTVINDINKTNYKRLKALEGLLRDFDNLTEDQKEEAYNTAGNEKEVH